MNSRPLDGKVALVTGAGGTMGRAVVRALVDDGCRVALVDIAEAAMAMVHGLGFAGALREVGLPAGDFPLAMFSFNVGVELGQLMFVGTVLVVLAALRRFLRQLPAWMDAMPAYAIGTMASFWWLQRMAPLF